jgi:hypothetical protein
MNAKKIKGMTYSQLMNDYTLKEVRTFSFLVNKKTDVIEKVKVGKQPYKEGRAVYGPWTKGRPTKSVPAWKAFPSAHGRGVSGDSEIGTI